LVEDHREPHAGLAELRGDILGRHGDAVIREANAPVRCRLGEPAVRVVSRQGEGLLRPVGGPPRDQAFTWSCVMFSIRADAMLCGSGPSWLTNAVSQSWCRLPARNRESVPHQRASGARREP
jgi:hypothetical protein